MSYIYQEVNECEFVDAFRRLDRLEGFGRAALRALFAHLDGVCAETGEPYALDVVELCCDWSSHGSALDAAREYGFAADDDAADDDDDDADEAEAEALEWLTDRTVVLSFVGGVLIQNF